MNNDITRDKTRLAFKNYDVETQEECLKEVHSALLIQELLTRITKYEEMLRGFNKVMEWGNNEEV